MSPNQRKKEKRSFNLWLTPEERERLERVADAYGVNMTEMIKIAVETAANVRGLNAKKGGENK